MVQGKAKDLKLEIETILDSIMLIGLFSFPLDKLIFSFSSDKLICKLEKTPLASQGYFEE